MQPADDVVNLIAGGRGASKRFLQPIVRGIADRVLGGGQDASEVTDSAGDSVTERLREGGRGLVNSCRNFLSRRDGRLGEGEAREVREEADDESITEEGGGCCRHLNGGFKIHILFFLFTFALTLNWSATGYSIGRKVCLARNASAKPHTTPEEFCRRWLVPDNGSVHSPAADPIENWIDNFVLGFRGNRDSGGLLGHPMEGSVSTSNLTGAVDADQWSGHHRRHHGRKRGEAEETAELYVIYQAIVALVPPALVMIIVILSYRDEFENFRNPLLVGMIGTALSTISNLVSSRFPNAPLFYDILTPLGEMLSGGLPLVMMSVYVQIAASVPAKGRTTAFFLLQVFFIVSFALARLVSAIVVNSFLETLPLFVASLIVLAVAVILAVILVEHVDLSVDAGEKPHRRRGHHRPSSSKNPVLLSSRLFSHHHLLHSVRGLVRDQAQGTKYELLFVMATVFFLVATTNGSVAGFFLENTNQDGVVLDSIVIIATVLIVLPIFVIIVRKLPFDPNYTVTFIGVFFLTAGQSLNLASIGGGQNSAAVNHIQHILRTLSNLAPAGMRAHVATLVDRQRFGKAFAAVAACEAVAPLIGSAMHRLIGRGFGQIPLLLLLWGPLLVLGIGKCRGRGTAPTATAVAAVEGDE